MDRIAAERVANYQTEYNAIGGKASKGGASAQQAAATARRNVAATHGAQHLPEQQPLVHVGFGDAERDAQAANL